MTMLYVVQEASGWEFGDIVAVFNNIKFAKKYVEAKSKSKADTMNYKTWLCGNFQITKIHKPKDS
jgi:hypothetical protein